ncbi:MAG TPA: hypothetical protein PKD90_10040 [Phnomibacter sp.]|nr:hypothetical protein [Phnomibacter sp.]
MTKNIIASLVAGVLLMAWQTLSFTALQLHASQEQYTPAQDTLLQTLSAHLKEKGQYYLPNLPQGSSQEAYEKAMEQAMGKPAARILYYPQLKFSMGVNIGRNLATNILLGFVLVWLLLKLKSHTMGSIITACLGVGFMAFCFYPYPVFIWYQTPGIMIELLDALVAFGLAGLWLGWDLPRGTQKASRGG